MLEFWAEIARYPWWVSECTISRLVNQPPGHVPPLPRNKGFNSRALLRETNGLPYALIIRPAISKGGRWSRGAPVDSAQGTFSYRPRPEAHDAHVHGHLFVDVYCHLLLWCCIHHVRHFLFGKSEKGTCGTVKMIQKIQQYIEFSSTFWWICLEVWNMCVWKNTRYLRTYIYRL